MPATAKKKAATKNKSAPKAATIIKMAVSSGDLQTHLSLVSKVVPSNPVLPVLDSVLIKAVGENQIVIIGTNLETTVEITQEVQLDPSVTAVGNAIAIPAKLLTGTIKDLPLQPITLEAEEGTNNVRMVSAYGSYELQGWPGDDFPETDQLDDATTFTVPAGVLKEAIDRTRWCTSTDELRPAMTGVLFSLTPDSLTLVATDAHKLASYEITTERTPDMDLVDIDESRQMVIPGSSLKLVASMLPSTDEAVEVAFTGSHVRFDFGYASLTCRIIDARYPDYNAIMPKDNKKELVVDRTSLINCVKRVVKFANGHTNQVVCELQDGGTMGTMNVRASDMDMALKAIESLAVQFSHKKFKVGFNGKFLMECAGNFGGEELRMTFDKATTASMIYEQDTDHCYGNYCVLLMPVMLAND